MSDVNIYDDPNILIGDSGTEKYVANDFKLRTIFKTKLPWENPPEKGIEIFDKWANSYDGSRWFITWDELASLEIDEYINLYSQFPDQFLSRFIGVKDIAYPVYKSLKNFHLGTSRWLYWLAHFDRTKPVELEDSQLLQFELFARASIARLYISQQIIDSPEFHYGSFFKHNPAFLWLWWEIGYCVQNVKSKGIEKPIRANQIQSKTELYKETGLITNLLTDIENKNTCKFSEAENLQDVLDNLPGIIEWASSIIADQDTTYRITYHYPYEQLVRKIRYLYKNNPEYQLSYIYSDNGVPKVFRTGCKQKRPKC